ncbi:MAG: hypothetical protein RR141_05225, partial [Rikenellaceae bacterium]
MQEKTGDEYDHYATDLSGDVSLTKRKRSADIIEFTKVIDKAGRSAYRIISANLELGLSFQEIAESSGLAKEMVESMYAVEDKKINPRNYNDDGSAKTAEQLAAEEAASVKQKTLDDAAAAKKIKDGKAAEDAAKDAKRQREKDAEQKIKDAEKADKLLKDTHDAAIALSNDQLLIENDRYNKQLQKFEIFGKAKEDMTEEQISVLTSLE